MTRRRRIIGNIIIVAGIAIVSGGAFWWLFEPMHLRIRLLCRTDHLALLEGCQELSRQASAGKLLTDMDYRFRPWPWPYRTVSRFPKAIRTLRPSSIYINEDGRVMVEMFGGLSHFGVYAYPEGYKKKYPEYKYGDRELIPNLWYYDDDYHKDPQFDEAITAIMTRFRKPPPHGEQGVQ